MAPVFAKINWAAIDAIDQELMMKQVLSPIEAPGDFATNLWHFAHGTAHFALVMFFVLPVFFATMRIAGNTRKSSLSYTE